MNRELDLEIQTRSKKLNEDYVTLLGLIELRKSELDIELSVINKRLEQLNKPT